MLNNLQQLIDQHPYFGSELSIDLFSIIDSTNQYILNNSHAVCTKPIVAVAEHQTLGRGRNNKSWSDVPGDSILLSYGFCLPAQYPHLSMLPLIVGVIVAETLQRSSHHIGLKWPNDIMLNGCKVGGILLESKVSSQGIFVAVGLGLNVRNIPNIHVNHYPPSCLQMNEVERNALIIQCIEQLHLGCQNVSQYEISGWLERYKQYNTLLNKAVYATIDGVRKKGSVQGVDTLGRLILDIDGEQCLVVDATITEVCD